MKKRVILSLTLTEAKMLAFVAGNGWGDGDFADYLHDGPKIKTCIRVMAKLDAAIRKAQSNTR